MKNRLILISILLVLSVSASVRANTPYRQSSTLALAEQRLHSFSDFRETMHRISISLPTAPSRKFHPVFSVLSFKSHGERALLQASPLEAGIDFEISLERQFLRHFENEDQLVGFVFYMTLIHAFSEEHLNFESAVELGSPMDLTKLQGDFGRLDLQVMELMFTHGYDPREFHKWVLLMAGYANQLGRHGRYRSLFYWEYLVKRLENLFPIQKPGDDYVARQEYEEEISKRVSLVNESLDGLIVPYNIRSAHIIRWLQEKESKADLPMHRDLPREIELIAHPERMLILTNAGLLEQLLQNQGFKDLPVLERIEVLSKVALPHLNSAGARSFDAFIERAFSIVGPISEKANKKIDSLIISLASASGDVAVKQAAFLYFMERNFTLEFSPEALLGVFDSISSRGQNITSLDSLRLVENNARIHGLQKLDALMKLSAVISNATEWDDLSRLLLKVLNASPEWPKGYEKWIQKGLIRPFVRRVNQESLFKETRTELLGKVRDFDSELRGIATGHRNHFEKNRATLDRYASELGGLSLSNILHGASELLGAAAHDIGDVGRSNVSRVVRLVKAGLSWRPSISKSAPQLLPASSLAVQTEELLNAARGITDSRAIYGIFSALNELQNVYLDNFPKSDEDKESEDDLRHVALAAIEKLSPRLESNDPLWDKFIDSIYRHGSVAERAGINWPVVFSRNHVDWSDSSGLPVRIKHYLKNHRQDFSVGDYFSILRLMLNQGSWSFQVKLGSRSENDLEGFGMTTELLLRFLEAEFQGEPPEEQVKNWIHYWAVLGQVGRFVFPKAVLPPFGIQSRLWPAGSVFILKKILGPIERVIAAAPEDQKEKTVDAALDKLSALVEIQSIGRQDFEVFSFRDPRIDEVLRTAINKLRYRPLPRDLAEFESHYATLTLEEKQSFLIQFLRSAKSPDDFGAFLMWTRKLNEALASAKIGYNREFKNAFSEKLGKIYSGALATGDRKFLYGIDWPAVLSHPPTHATPSAIVVKLFEQVSRRLEPHPYARFQILSSFLNPGQYFKFQFSDLVLALEDSPHFKEMKSEQQLGLLGQLTDFTTHNNEGNDLIPGHWPIIYGFLLAHILEDHASPQALSIAVSHQAGGFKIPPGAGGDELTQLVEFARNERKLRPESSEKRRATLLKVILRNREAQMHLPEAQVHSGNLKAAALIATLDPDYKISLRKMSFFRRSFIPHDLKELLAAEEHPLIEGGFLPVELDEALQNCIKHAAADDLIVLLEKIRKHGSPSEALQSLVLERINDFFETALQKADYDVLNLEASRWPGFVMQAKFNFQMRRAQRRAFLDARLPALQRAVLLTYMSPQSRKKPPFEKIRDKLTDPQEFFRLVNDQGYHLRGVEVWDFDSGVSRTWHYWRYWRSQWPMTSELVFQILNNQRLWAKANGNEMGHFIHHSKDTALLKHLHEQIAQQTDKLNELERRRYGDGLAGFRQNPFALLDPSAEKLDDEVRERSHRLASLKQQIERIDGQVKSMQAVADAQTTARAAYKGPAYEYRLDVSENFQKYIVDQMKFHRTYPLGLLNELKLFMGLASRGATAFTDVALHRLLMKLDQTMDSHSSTMLREVLEKGLIWDLGYRREIFDCFNKHHYLLENKLMSIARMPQFKRENAILEEIARVRLYFPEESAVRAELLEEISGGLPTKHSEAKIIHAAKSDTNTDLEKSAFHLFIHLDSLLISKQQKLSFIIFLQGKGPLPERIGDIVRQGIGESRLIRQFQGFQPEMRALLLLPLIGPPYGLMIDLERTGLEIDMKLSKQLVSLIIEDAGEYKDDARHIIDALLYAMDHTQPHLKYSLLAFLLGQVGRTGGSAGEKLRVILDSLGGTGQSLGQILVQRQILSPEILVHLHDLQDNGRRPHRLSVFNQVSELLGVVDVDDVLNFEAIAGAGTARVILRAKIKDPAILARLHAMGFGVAATKDGIIALKLLRPNLKRETQLEIDKMNYFLKYLEAHAPPKFRRLRGPIDALQRSLVVQADLSLEAKAYPKMVELYEQDSGMKQDFSFRVVRPDSSATSESEYAYEEYAEGEGLRSLAQRLPESELRRILDVIYNKERSILFAPEGTDDLIHFEDDRHMGNFKIDLSRGVISIFDYPLIASITGQRRQATLKLLGLLERIRQDRLRIIPPILVDGMLQEFLTLASEPGMLTEEKKDELKQLFRHALDTLRLQSSWGERSTVSMVLDLLAAGESVEVPVHFSVYSYLKALGYVERYAPSSEEFLGFMKEKITALFGEFDASRIGIADQCAFALSRIMNALPGGK